MQQSTSMHRLRTALEDILDELNTFDYSDSSTSMGLINNKVNRLIPHLSNTQQWNRPFIQQDVQEKFDDILGLQSRQKKQIDCVSSHLEKLKLSVEELIQSFEEEKDFSFVGRLTWHLDKGSSWILGPESVFKMNGITRRLLLREAYMLESDVSKWTKIKQICQTASRRLITGEPLIVDQYYAEIDNAVLEISTDEIGSTLYEIDASKPIITRKTVCFANQKDVKLRIQWPSPPNRLKKAIYGVGYAFQRFDIVEGGTEHKILISIEGDMEMNQLKAGETIRLDPRHVYAWDETVSHHLVKLGPLWDQLLRGLIPFYTEFRGPGRVWHSTAAFGTGYLGYWGTPTAWLWLIYNRVVGIFKALIGFGSNS